MIYKCEGCGTVCALAIETPNQGQFTVTFHTTPTPMTFDIVRDGEQPQPGLCPRCSLAWFRSLSRGNDPVRVARIKARK